MSLFTRLLNRKTRPIRREPVAQVNRFRPRLEGLEVREVPANITWAPVGGSTAGGTAANWVGGVVPGTNDTIVVNAGTGSLDMNGMATATFAGIQVDYGFTNTITTGFGGLKVKSGFIKDGSIKLRNHLTIDAVTTGSFVFGTTNANLPSIGEASGISAKRLEFTNGSIAEIKRLQVLDDVMVEITSATVDLNGSLRFGTVLPGAGNGNATGYLLNHAVLNINAGSDYTGGEYTSGGNQYWKNQLTVSTGGTINFTGNADVFTYLSAGNGGAIHVQSGTTHTYGWDTTGYGVNMAGSGLYLTTGAVLETTKLTGVTNNPNVFIATGALNIERQGVTSGAVTAYIVTTKMQLTGTDVEFETNVSLGSRSGQLILDMGSADVIFDQWGLLDPTSFQPTLNYTNHSCDQMLCNNFRPMGATTSSDSQMLVNFVGTVPGTPDHYKMIDCSGTYYFDFMDWRVSGTFTGILDHNKTGNDLWVGNP